MAAAAAAAPHVVIGAGGPTGLECVTRLLQVCDAPVRAVVRQPAAHEAKLRAAAECVSPGAASRLTVVAGDVTDPLSLAPALSDAGSIIFAASGKGYWSAGPVDHQGVVNVIDAVKACQAGSSSSSSVPRIVLISSMLTDPANRFHPVRLLLNNIRWGLMDAKWAGEEALRKSGLPHCILRPGGLNNGPGGRSTLVAEVNAARESLMGSITRADVAAVAVEAVTHEAGKNKTLSIVAAKGSALPEGASLADELSRLFATLGG